METLSYVKSYYVTSIMIVITVIELLSSLQKLFMLFMLLICKRNAENKSQITANTVTLSIDDGKFKALIPEVQSSLT